MITIAVSTARWTKYIEVSRVPCVGEWIHIGDVRCKVTDVAHIAGDITCAASIKVLANA